MARAAGSASRRSIFAIHPTSHTFRRPCFALARLYKSATVFKFGVS